MNQSLIIYIYTLSLHDALPILHCTLADVGRSRTRPSLAMSPPSLPPISTTASTIPPPITESDRPSAPSAEPWGPRHPAGQRRRSEERRVGKEGARRGGREPEQSGGR